MKRRIQAGPGASSLILMVVIMAMSILGMLALLNAKNDEVLAIRSVDVAQETYALPYRAQETFAALDALYREYGDSMEMYLSEDVYMEDGIIYWQEYGDGRYIDCSAEVQAGKLEWLTHMPLVEVDDGWDWF